MRVIVDGYKYKVWDVHVPDKRRFLVTKGKKCQCGYVKCEHVRAVGEYLQRGGIRAPDEPYDPRGTLEDAIARIRALRRRALEENTMGCTSEATKALVGACRASCEAERIVWIKAYSLPQMWPVELTINV